MRRAILATWILGAACYSPRFEQCSIACGPADGCPHETTCGRDGFCHAPGEPACTTAPDASIDPLPDAGDPIQVDAGSDPDAPPPDASCRVPLLQNGGFETVVGSSPRQISPWQNDELAGEIVLATGEGAPLFTAYAGTYGLRVSGNNVDGFLYQFIGVLPANAKGVELRARYRVVGVENVRAKDRLTFRLADAGTLVLIALGSPLDGADHVPEWTPLVIQVPVTPTTDELYLDLHFQSGTMLSTSFELDDLALDAIICE